MEFKCSLCSSGFYQKRYLQEHLSRLHGIKNSLKKTDNEVVCIYCEKKYSSQKSLSKHVVQVHKVVKATVVCQEESCVEKFRNVCDLRTHLCSTHGMKTMEECKELNFEKYSGKCISVVLISCICFIHRFI